MADGATEKRQQEGGGLGRRELLKALAARGWLGRGLWTRKLIREGRA